MRLQLSGITAIFQAGALRELDQALRVSSQGEESENESSRVIARGFGCSLPSLVPAFSGIVQQADTAGQAPASAPTTTQTTTLPAAVPAGSQGSAPLRVMVGKSLLINTTEQLTANFRHRPDHRLRPGHHPDADSGSRQISRRSFAADLG